jgi:hypothetical protein
MNEVVTFFRQRKNDPGETYVIKMGTCRFFVYSRKSILSQLPKHRETADQDTLRQAFQDLQKAIGKQDGGFIVKIIDDSNARTVEVAAIGMKFDAVSELLVLSPGRPPRFSNARVQKITLSSHLIVPVDEDSLAHLHQLIDELAWLPADIEALMINAIRRPSLDARLDRIEEKLFGETAEQTANAGWLERTKLRINRWLTPTTVRAGAVTLLALLLGANVFLLRRIDSKLIAGQAPSTAASDTSATATAASQTATIEKPAVQPNGETFVNKAKKLFELLRKKRRASAKLLTLYDAHFTEIDNSNLADGEIVRLFRQYDGTKGAPANRPFLWGMIKLQALELEPSLDDAFLKDWQEYTATKAAFEKIGLEKIQKDAAKQGLLAALACRMGYDTPDAPGLKETTTTKPFVFAPNGKCDQYTDDHIEKGLDGLIASMEKMP